MLRGIRRRRIQIASDLRASSDRIICCVFVLQGFNQTSSLFATPDDAQLDCTRHDRPVLADRHLPNTPIVVPAPQSAPPRNSESQRWGGMALPLQRLLERPYRTLPGGILRKFLRRLSQFPLSFPAKSRWAPRSSGELRSKACHPCKQVLS